VQRLRRRLQAWFPDEPSGGGDTPSSGPADPWGGAGLAPDGQPRDTATPALLRRQEDPGWWGSVRAHWQQRLNRRASRLREVVLQLPDALDLMARALRSGHAFSTALQMAAEEGPQPLAGEFDLVAEQIELGGDPDDAFEALAQRVPVDEIRFFVMAVKLQRQTGGQLAEVLGNIAQLVRQRLQLTDKVRVLTAEARLSAKVLAALPPATAGALLAVRPEFVSLLWTDPTGVRMLQGSALLMVLGSLWLWRLTRIRV
jgi:tight adherence protein B